MTQGSLITSRFKQGKLAIPLWLLTVCLPYGIVYFLLRGHWINGYRNKNSPLKFAKNKPGVPPTKRMADDVILALDLQTGTQIWKTTLSGVPSGRSSSSTPCFADNKFCSWRRPIILRESKMENYCGNANSNRGNRKLPFSTTEKYLFLPTPYVLSTEKQVSKFGKTIL